MVVSVNSMLESNTEEERVQGVGLNLRRARCPARCPSLSLAHTHRGVPTDLVTDFRALSAVKSLGRMLCGQSVLSTIGLVQHLTSLTFDGFRI
jgi:hypothetical protein